MAGMANAMGYASVVGTNIAETCIHVMDVRGFEYAPASKLSDLCNAWLARQAITGMGEQSRTGNV